MVPTQTTKTKSKDEVIEDIKKHLGVDEALAEQFAEPVIFLERIQKHFKPDALFFTDKNTEIDRQLGIAAKSLNYKSPYRIAFVGNTGAGKSELINALLGRSLVPSEAVSSVTGTAVEVFFDTEQTEETVGIVLRTEADILALIGYFIDEFGIEKMPETLSQAFSDSLRTWQPSKPLTDEMENQRFQNLRTSLANLITCYVRYGSDEHISEFLIPKNFRGSFSLNGNVLESRRSSQIEKYLNELINEDSSLNKNQQYRRIDLIDSLTYKVKPPQTDENHSQFTLPPNVCLVDLPGINPNMPLHNLIFSKGVKNANVVVLILPPNRIPEIASPLYSMVNRSITYSRGIFLVVNRWDEFPKDSKKNMAKLANHMDNILEYFGVKKYYKTSAYVALNAQLGIKGDTLDAPEFYEKAAKSLNAAPDHENALEASNVPELVKDLMDFIHIHLIQDEFGKGKTALRTICKFLIDKYTLTASTNQFNNVQEFLKLVSKCQEDVEIILGNFHKEQFDDERMNLLRDELESEAMAICDHIDRCILQRDLVSQLWKQCYTTIPQKTILTHDQTKEVKISWPSFLDQIQLEIWKMLPKQMEGLSNLLTDAYRTAIKNKQIEQDIINIIANLAPSIKGASAIDGLENEIQEMSRKLTELSHHVALLQVYNPDILLNLDEQAELKETLDKLPKQKELPPDQFRELIKVVRSHYESAVLNWSVDMLLEFYKYQMAYIEQTLIEISIKEFFADLNKQVSQPEFCEEVLATANAHAQNDIELMAAKRRVLNELCGNQKL